MNLRFEVPDYELIEAELLCIKAPTGQDSRTADFSLSEIVRVRVENGVVSQLQIETPGTFIFTLTSANVRNISSEKRFLIPLLPLGKREITASDLESGEKRIVVRPLGRLRLRVVDSSGNGVPNAILGLFSPDSEGVLEAITNDLGEASHLLLQEGTYSVGLPGDVRISSVIRGGQVTSLEVVKKYK